MLLIFCSTTAAVVHHESGDRRFQFGMLPMWLCGKKYQSTHHTLSNTYRYMFDFPAYLLHFVSFYLFSGIIWQTIFALPVSFIHFERDFVCTLNIARPVIKQVCHVERLL